MTTGMMPARSTSNALTEGQTLGGRFIVQSRIGEDALGVFVSAKDSSTKKSITLRHFSEGLFREEPGLSLLREQCKKAAALLNRNIAATYGMGRDPNGYVFVATEATEGQTLEQLLSARAEVRQPMSVQGAYNVIAHVARALSYAAPTMSHGALRPSVIWIASSGRVRIAEFGLTTALLRTVSTTWIPQHQHGFIAPEVLAGEPATARSDVYSLGALLCTMFTLQPVAADSALHPSLPPDLQPVIAQCLSRVPAHRLASSEEMLSVLIPLVSRHTQTHVDPMDVDVDIASIAPSKPQPKNDLTAPRVAPPVRPQAGPVRPSLNEKMGAMVPSETPRLDDLRISVQAPIIETAAKPPASWVQKVSQNDAPRWMVIKNKLDHGPFSGRELMELIAKGEVLDTHSLLNMDTGERRPVQTFPEFTQAIEHYKVRKQEETERREIAQTEKAETRSNVAKVFVAVSVATVLAVAGIGILLRAKNKRDESARSMELASLYESGKMDVRGNAGLLPEPKAGRSRRRAGGTGALDSTKQASVSGGLSYDEAMNQAVNLGDVSQAGSERRLSSGEVAEIMNKHIDSLGVCVGPELRQGGLRGVTVQVDLAIAGSGQVLGASVHAGSPEFRSCVSARVRRITFPTFPAPRMGARYSFSVD